MMKSLASNPTHIGDRSSLIPRKISRKYLGLLLMLTLLCLSAAMSAQQAITTYYPLLPKYEVLGVIYAPPGNYQNSFVSYNESTTVGSSHSQSWSSSNTNTQTTATTSGFSLFGFGSETQNTTSDAWTTATQNQTSVSVTSLKGNGMELYGPYVGASVGVDHDFDQIVLLLNPVINTTLTYNPSAPPNFSFLWQGYQYNSCELGNAQDPVNFDQLISGCDPLNGLQPDIVHVPVWCLKNPYSQAIPPGFPISCAQWFWENSGQQEYISRYWDLDTWGVDPTTGVPLGPGLTVHDLADILRADPYVTQTLVADNYQKNPTTGAAENPYTSPCHPTYGLDYNPDATEIIPNPSSFSAPFSGTSWPANYCGTPGTTMARQDDQDATVYFSTGSNTNGTLQRTNLSQYASTATDTHTYSQSQTTTDSFSFSASIGIPLGEGVSLSSSLFSGGFNFSTSSGTGYSYTDTQSYSNTNQTGVNSSASWQITGPTSSDNYKGPTEFTVYDDNVYGTFSFWSPQTLLNLPTLPTSSPIGVSMAPASGVTCSTATTCNFGTVTVGKSSGAITVTLTNSSPYQMTMVSPSLSFSDQAPDANSGYAQVSSFVIVAGNDLCAGKVLAAGKTCTVKIKFSPRVAAAPNVIMQPPNYPVHAYMVAAATEGIPFFTGAICSTGYCSSALVTNTVIDVTGPGQETYTTVSGTAVPAAANCTNETPYCDVGATLTPAPISNTKEQGQTAPISVTFTNYYNKPVTINSGTGNGVVLRGPSTIDTSSYSVTSDACSGQTVQPLKTCAVTVLYAPTSTLAAGTYANTELSVVGAVTGSGNAPAALATDGISYETVGMTFDKGSYAAHNCDGDLCPYPGDWPASVTITNNSSTTINSISTSISQYFLIGGACTSLAAGKSCTLSADYDNTCTPPQGQYRCSISNSGTINVTGTFADTSLKATSSVGISGHYDYDGCNPRTCG